MKLVSGDAFESTVVVAGTTQHFDTPRCAFEHTKDKRSVRVQEYYDRTWLNADEAKFVKNSDVMGPMGKDFIPVNPKHVDKFLREHGGVLVSLDEIGAATTAP